MKFYILVYGCYMNYSDAARIKTVLINLGFRYVEHIDDADIVILVTCSVRQKAEDKITGKLRHIPKDKKIWLTGCMVGHNLKHKEINLKRGNFIGELLADKPNIYGFTNNEIAQPGEKLYVNYAFKPIFNNLKKKTSNLELMFRIDDIGFLPYILSQLNYKIDDISLIQKYTSILPTDSNYDLSSNTSAFVPVQTGCSQFCSYCIVPYARGLEKFRPVDEIISEVKYHVKNGAKDILLTGQIVNKQPDFVKIIKKCLKIKSIKWLRYSSPYPTYYSQELLELHEQEQRLCPRIHAPLQSGSDKILRKMLRGYNAKQYYEFLDKVKNLKRDISITTDLIVGFPGETDKDFQDSLDMIEYARFDMIYIGKYSPRPRTLAANKYTDDITDEIKFNRWNQVNDVLYRISNKNNQKEIGRIQEVLLQGIDKNQLLGITNSMKNVVVNSNETSKYKSGDFINSCITHVQSLKLEGEIIF